MESVEVVCVEIQENENGEIVYVEKMENNNSTEFPEDFCVMECEIATTENSSQSHCEESDSNSPVEIIVFPNFSDKLPQCVTNEEQSEEEDTIEPDNDYNMTLSGAELALHKDTQRFIEDTKTNDDFDFVLKLAMRSESNGLCEPTKRPFEKVRIIEEISEESEAAVDIKKSKLWTLLDKQDKCSSASKRSERTTGSVDVRRTYSGIIPKKSYSKETHNGCFSEHPFRCKICDQSFRQDSSLKIHLKVHAGKFSDSCIIN
ncbi:hypothetical protein R5R35_003167 [Gryllus longicercus]|uniref:C2H2-type domain-containing protein n=1 Tax=Gryllus longicercus TaxID=2509291 RepID=A0AAN9VWI2_9ORTH